MKFEAVSSPSGAQATHLWVMLPGAYMKPDDYIRAGFPAAVHARRLPHDIALLEASISEMVDGSALAFLQDYLGKRPSGPAPRVCVLGISLGAQLAMQCLARASAASPRSPAAVRVDHALVLAPYLGPRDVLADVAAGAANDDALPGLKATSCDEREIWRWLRDPVAQKPPLYLGYGSDDRFAYAHAMMAQSLPQERVDTQPGGHEWPVWTALWNRHLALFQ